MTTLEWEVSSLDNSRYTTKIDLAVDTIRQAIIDGNLQPGNRLRQEDLAQRFGISATPIREALRRLQAEGLVQSEAHKGCWVTPFEVDLTREIYMVRGLLEGLAARLAAENITPEMLVPMEAAQDRLRQALRNNDTHEMRLANYTFHMCVYKAAGSPVLLGLIEGLLARSPYDSLWVKPRRAMESTSEHDRILEALRYRDPDRAAEETQRHIRSVGDFLIESMAGGVAPALG